MKGDDFREEVQNANARLARDFLLFSREALSKLLNRSKEIWFCLCSKEVKKSLVTILKVIFLSLSLIFKDCIKRVSTKLASTSWNAKLLNHRILVGKTYEERDKILLINSQFRKLLDLFLNYLYGLSLLCNQNIHAKSVSLPSLASKTYSQNLNTSFDLRCFKYETGF